MQNQDGSAVHFEFLFDGDDELAVDRPQGFGLFVQPGVIILVQGHLENELLVVLADEQGFGRGSLTELSSDDESLRQSVALLGLERVVDDGFLGGGEFVLDFIEQRQEIFDGADAGENVRVGTPLNHFFQLGTGTVQDG